MTMIHTACSYYYFMQVRFAGRFAIPSEPN